MTASAFSAAANDIYLLPDLFGAIPPFIYISLTWGAVAAALCITVISMLSDMTIKRTAANYGTAFIVYLIGAVPYGVVKNATIFDAPSVVAGTVKTVQVIPGGLFAPDASNVTFADGTGMSFRGRPSLPVGATILKKANAWDGKDYYTVPTDGRPVFFTAR